MGFSLTLPVRSWERFAAVPIVAFAYLLKTSSGFPQCNCKFSNRRASTFERAAIWSTEPARSIAPRTRTLQSILNSCIPHSCESEIPFASTLTRTERMLSTAWYGEEFEIKGQFIATPPMRRDPTRVRYVHSQRTFRAAETRKSKVRLGTGTPGIRMLSPCLEAPMKRFGGVLLHASEFHRC
jgi:hypothetical protein